MALPQWMQKLRQRLTSKGKELDAAALEELRRRHKARCLSFKLLIAANNQALEIMTDMEEALQGGRPFGMQYVRSQCARVLAKVHQIVVQLNALSDNAFPGLGDSLRRIAEGIQAEMAHKAPTDSGPLLLPLREIRLEHVDAVGSKVASLAEAAGKLGLRIPEGFVLTARAYRHFLAANDLESLIDQRIQTADAERPDELFTLSSAIQQAIIKASVPEDLAREMEAAFATLRAEHGADCRLAVRSSALGEDLLETSFAGQYHSELNVPGEDLLQTYKEVVASKYGVTAMSYRLSRGIPDEDVAMCVACMRMLEATAGGVVYTRNPLGLRHDYLMLTVVLGLPKAVVDGKGQSDLFLVSREPLAIVRRTISAKRSKYINDPEEGVVQVPTPREEAGLPALRDEEILELARTCLDIETVFGQPQDIEFALDEQRRLYILQCRPLQLREQDELPELPDLVEAPAPVLMQGGETASAGAAAGEVYVLQKDIDVVRCPDGAVAVTAQALPRWAPLLSRVAAMVAEQGSLAGHLGNVAREFGVPALFGLENAVQTLDGAGLVTVDADARTIYEGRVEELLVNRPKPRLLMVGSPVHAVLERVVRHIVPLNLLDPAAPEFSPEGCRTLHDVTRFCHEMSVKYMFTPDADQSELHRLSKQLFHKVPMQYWVIDLDDGMEVPPGVDRGRFVLLEDIRSVPMLALWQGMTAVPADELPQVDARGFMSVLLEATTNPELESGLGTSFTMRNYFMISREFCSLQSRFGFHFCTVESSIGPQAEENYASFQYKGGAADMERKVLRAELVRDILEEYGFRTERKHDSLFARLEGLEAPAMEQRLKVLGYVIIHTRQLDMLMSNAAAVAERKARMQREIRVMLAP